MPAYLDKKEIPSDEGTMNQYFIMGIDHCQLDIIRSGVQKIIYGMQERSELSPEERALYSKAINLKNTLNHE